MSPRLPLIFALAWLLPHGQAYAQGDSQQGRNEVEVADNLSLKRPAGGKPLELKVYYPRTGGPFPVIIFSHGFGGSKDVFSPISQHWASQGYVVIHPSHNDGPARSRGDSDSEADEKPAAGRRSGLIGKLNDPEKISGRVADLVLVLDRLDELPKLRPGLQGKLNRDAIGVAGHSFGAYTSMLIGGVTVDLGSEKGKSYLDKRVKCILPISAQGTGQQGLTEKSFESLKLPLLTITGTRDRGVGGQGYDWRMEPFRFSSPGDKFLVVIDGATHVSYGGGLRARGEAAPEIVKLCSTCFWDAYLKDSEEAQNRLRTDRLEKELAGKARLEKK